MNCLMKCLLETQYVQMHFYQVILRLNCGLGKCVHALNYMLLTGACEND